MPTQLSVSGIVARMAIIGNESQAPMRWCEPDGSEVGSGYAYRNEAWRGADVVFTARDETGLTDSFCQGQIRRTLNRRAADGKLL